MLPELIRSIILRNILHHEITARKIVILSRLQWEAYKHDDEGLISDTAYKYWFTTILSPVRLIFFFIPNMKFDAGKSDK